MTRKQKRLQRIRNNPKNVHPDDLQRILEDHGFELVRIRGSHHAFAGFVGREERNIIIPIHSKVVKTVYVREVLALIDEIEALSEDGTSHDEA
ncbi:MAG: type II toxin-antitoxin system HicA family toxin [Anaerolineae bacterium]|nr:type II toxin-antitoxin system HicA family toxin [Anaerolineae bacterium]MCA9893451.1 type II toxin-antitoxin system HicA family toxin [Anaerolineae bacterium]